MQFRLTYITIMFTFAIFCSASANAQKSKLVIQINSEFLGLNDSLDFVATYKLGEKQLPPATLALVMKENNGDGIWQMRWPMINGHAEGTLVFPKGIRKGNYTLYFAVQARFFGLFGHVLYPPNMKTLSAVIYSQYINPKQFDLAVDKNGNFKIDKFLFENTAVLELEVPQKKRMPAITMDAWLDSTFEPAAFISKEITVGMGENSKLQNKKVDNWMAYFDPFFQTTILGNMPAPQKFDSVYVPPIFKKDIIQQFDCLSDSELIKSKSLEAFLLKYLPEFQLDPGAYEGQTPTATANGHHYVFYLDGYLTTYADLNDITLSDIATIKIVPPIISSMSAFTKRNSVIALFTKQGPFCTQDVYRYKYVVNGYQPPVYQLPPNFKMFATSPYYLH